MLAAFAAVPKWVTTGQSQEYPAEMYFVGVGMSNKSVDQAKEQAVADVAKQISVNIKATTLDVQSEETFGSKSISSYEKAESQTRLSTSGRIEGISVVETAPQGKAFYALAVLDKQKFAALQRTRIAEIRKNIEQSFEAAKTAASSGKILKALQSVKEIRVLSNELIEQRRLLSAAAVPTQKESVPVSKQDLEGIIEKVVASLRLEKISGDAQSFVVGQTLGMPLVVKLSADEAGTLNPVPGIPLVVSDNNNKKFAEAITRSDGMAEIFPAEEAAGAGVGRHQVSVSIQLPVSAALKKQLKAMTQSFSYEVTSNPAFTELAIKLPAGFAGSLDAVEKKLWSVLQKADIQKDEDAAFVLEMTLDPQEKGRVQGLSANNTFIEVATSAICALKQNDKEVLNFALDPAKGMGSTPEAALTKSIENLKLKKNLPVLVEKLRGGGTAAAKPKVAVFEFKNSSGLSDWYELAQSMTSMVITGLINSKKFEVVERDMLEKIMEEKKLGMSGATDLKEDVQIAQLAGATYLVLGSVSQQGSQIEADARLISVASASSIAAASGTAQSRADLRATADLIVEQLKKAKVK